MSNLRDTGFLILERVFTPDMCSSYVSTLNAHAASADPCSASSDSAVTPSASSSSSCAAAAVPKHHAARVHPDPSDESRTHKIQGVALSVPAVLDLFRHERIVSECRKTLGCGGDEKMDVFGTKYFPMHPGGTSVGWHQDSYYFGTGGDDLVCVSCAIYLEESTRTNGCLRLIPGSHLPDWDGGDPHKLRRREDGILPHRPGEGRWAHGDWIPDCPDGDAIDVEVPAGSVVLFDPRLVHGARPNESADPRRTRASVFGHIVPRSRGFANEYVDFTFGVYADRHQISE